MTEERKGKSKSNVKSKSKIKLKLKIKLKIPTQAKRGLEWATCVWAAPVLESPLLAVFAEVEG